MENDVVGARRREAVVRNRAARRAKWLKRKWRVSAKGNHYINAEGHNLVVFPDKYREGKWKFKVDGSFSRSSFDSSDRAKMALFEAFWRTIEPDGD